ncbi:TRAP transporter large permease [Roseitalea porphyridii]|uniref:TRAP transporter large permease protein n=1 Tax=Roseitalea porphyridii TaxID=1852022 RepID=A0A4P6V0L1_9HYPH|nr:TRAP transporter large permease [Roseitalea porphyridii]QBK30872.1 TRAP transporter large permease [Roseitalea porphyridii]
MSTLAAGFFFFILLGVPVAFVFGLAALVAVIASDLPLVLVAHRFVAGLNNFTLMAIPFFLLTGMLMEAGGLARRIIAFAMALVGWITGSLLMVAVLTATALAAMSGSGSADTAAVSSALMPDMRRRKYNIDFSAALIGTAGTLAQILPPSTMLVLIAVTNNLSVSALFLGGIIPGLLVVPALLYLSYRHAKKGGEQYAASGTFSLGEVGRTFIQAVPAMGLAVVISGGIFSGLFTPTEAAGVAVVYTILVGKFVYRELKWSDIPKVTLRAGAISSAIMFLVGGATIFNWLMAAVGVPDAVAGWFQANVESAWLFLVVMNIFLMLLGMPMEGFAIILLLSPIFLEVAASYGFDPNHIAIVFVFNCVIGMITPPFGGTLFVSALVAGRPISAVTRKVYPLWGVMTVVLLLITYVPDLVLFLPRAAGFVD